MAATKGKFQAMPKDMSLSRQQDEEREKTEQMLKPYAKWEEFLKSVPMAIATLGHLESIFVGRGYYVEQFSEVRMFRECLQKVTEEGNAALSKVYKNMHQIFTRTMLKQPVEEFLHEYNENNYDQLLTDLRKINDKGDNCLALAQEAKHVFLMLICAVQELLQVCLSDKETYEKKLKSIQISLVQEEEKKEKIKSIQQTKKKEVEEACRQLIKDLNSFSSEFGLFLMAYFNSESGNNLFNRMKIIFQKITGCSDLKGGQSLFIMMQQLLSNVIHLGKKPEGQLQEDEINRLINQFKSFEVGAQEQCTVKEKEIFQEIFGVGLAFCKKLLISLQGKEERKKEEIEETQEYQESLKLFRKCRELWEATYCLSSESNMSTGQDDSNQSVGGGACKAELSYQKLQVVRKEYLESLTEIHEPELINIACTMEKYKQVKDNCDTVGEMLSKGRDCLEMLKQQWENVVCFFEMIEFCLSQIKKDLHFVGDIPQITKSDPNLWIYIRALLMTFRVHLLCETYVQVHRQCLMSLDKIPEKVLTGKIPIKDAKKKCEDAQEAIEKLVLEKKKTIDEELNDRM